MDYFTVANEARFRYEERLREAEMNRQAARVHRTQPATSANVLVRAGETLVLLGERLKRQGGVTYAYDKR